MKKFALPLLLTLSACGTIFNGSSQDISFDSNQQGVQIYINGMKACKTPCTYPIDRQAGSFVISAKKTGFEEQQQIIKSQLSSIAILNLTFWPSWLTDVATGGMWKYNRNGIYIDMENKTSNHAQLQRIKKDIATRRFSLLNYNELKTEAASNKSGEYIKNLAAISNKSDNELITIIKQTDSEVNLAHTLTSIKLKN